MTRRRKSLTKSDYLSAYNYISGGMDRGEISSSEGYMRFRKADTPEKLQAWCDGYLDDDLWSRMRNSIRVERKRNKDYKTNRQKVRVDLDWLAWQRLSSMAEEEGRTLSEMILAYDDVYIQAKMKGIKAGS